MRRRTRLATLASAAAFLAATAAPANAQDDEVVPLLQDLIRLNTSNPPGNEQAVAEYLRDKLAPLGFQIEMFNMQRGHMSSHPYQSVWWQWPLMLRPIWYLFQAFGGSYRVVLLVGNPVIYWGGLASIAALATRWMGKASIALKYALGLYAFSMAIWIVIPKEVEFSYYYNLSAIWLCLVLGAFFTSFGERGRRWLGWFTVAAGGMFIYFYPVISAQALPEDNSWTNWVWMKSWY